MVMLGGHHFLHFVASKTARYSACVPKTGSYTQPTDPWSLRVSRNLLTVFLGEPHALELVCLVLRLLLEPARPRRQLVLLLAALAARVERHLAHLQGENLIRETISGNPDIKSLKCAVIGLSGQNINRK